MGEWWEKLTGDPTQEVPPYCWMGGYDADGEWQETKVGREIYPEGYFSLETGKKIAHPVTHWASFLAPRPPAKPQTLLNMVLRAACFLDQPPQYTEEEARWLANELRLAAEREKETNVRSS